MLRRKLEKSKKGFGKVQEEKFWKKVGKRLAKGWEELGKSLGKAWGKFGKGLGKVWEKLGESLEKAWGKFGKSLAPPSLLRAPEATIELDEPENMF
jgi:hypothetical protein